MAYDHLEIEARQRYWDEHGTFRAARRSGGPKRYVLERAWRMRGSTGVPRSAPCSPTRKSLRKDGQRISIGAVAVVRDMTARWPAEHGRAAAT